MRKIQNLPSFSPCVAGTVATLNLPLNYTYDTIMLEFTGPLVAAGISRIEVRANGEVFQEYVNGAADVNEINKFYKRGTSASHIKLHFRRPEYEGLNNQRLTGWGTADLKSATIAVTFTAGAGAGIGITPTAYCSEPTPMGLVTKIKNFPMNLGAGLNDVSNIVTGYQNGQPVPTAIAAIHMIGAANNITKCSVLANGINMWDELTTTQIEAYQTDAKRDPSTTTMTSVDFILQGDPYQALQGASIRDLRIKPTCTALGMTNFMVEYFDGLKGV